MKHFVNNFQLAGAAFHTTFFAAVLAGRVVTTGAALICVLWLGGWACRKVSPVRQSAGVELAWANGGAGGQAASTFSGVKINIEAYNKKREKDIADASVKLLSLAIALQSDLAQHPGSKPSAEAVKKAKAIEKLAHDVKESMKLNIIGPR